MSKREPSRKIGAAEYELLANEAAARTFPEYDAAAMSAIFNLIRVSNRIVKDMEIVVHRPLGLSFAAYRLLFTIRAVGAVNPNELARLSSVSTASMSSLLGTLEKHNLVDKVADPTDGRRSIVHLSAEGNRTLDELVRKNNLRETAWASILSPAESAMLAELLRKLLSNRPE